MKETKSYLFYFTLFFLIGLLTCFKISSLDVWWHLATGKWMLENGSVPRFDPFSYTAGNREWYDFSWLFQVLIFFTYKLFGINGLIFFKLFVALLTFLLLYKLLLKTHKDEFLSFSLAITVLTVSYGRFFVRPHIFLFLFLVVFLFLYRYWCVERKNLKRLLLSFTPVYLLWVNIHTSFVIVPAFLAIDALVKAVSGRFQESRNPFIAFLFLSVLMLLNPYGLQLPIKVIGSHFGSEGKDALLFINEWQPYDVFNLFSVLPVWELPFKLLFWSTVLVIGYLLLKNRKNLFSNLTLVLFSLLTVYAFLSHKRFTVLFAFISAVTLAELLKGFKKKVAFTAIFLLSTVSALWLIVFKSPDFKYSFGFGIKNAYPFQTVNFLKSHKIEGNLFNSYGFGGFIIWELYPEYRVFIDGRTPTLYSPGFFWKYRVAEKPNMVAFNKLKEEYGFSIVLTESKDLAGELINDENWCFLGVDDRAYLFVRKTDGSFYRCINYFNPTESIDKVITRLSESGKLKQLEKELRYLNQTFPDTGIVNNALGSVLFAEGKFREAIPFFKRAGKVLPTNPIVVYNLGMCYIKLKKYRSAERFFREAVKLGILSDIPKALYHLGYCYYREKKYDESVDVLKQYLNGFSEDDPAALEILGMDYFYLGEYKLAEKFLKRAIFLTEDREKRAKLMCNLGNAYLAQGKVEKAKELYKKALKLLPSLRAARENLKLIRGRGV